MTVFLEEKRGEEAVELKRELTKLKARRVQLLERGDTRSLKAVEKRIESIRYRLGRTEEREAIIKSELNDMAYLEANYTLEQYQWHAGHLKDSTIALRWGVETKTLRNWKKKEEEKLKTRIEEQEALIGQQVQIITELKKQNGELQDMLHGYENELNAASDAHNATIDELTKVQLALLESQAKERSTRMMLNEQIGENATITNEFEALRLELADVKRQLKEMTAKEFRVRIAFDRQVTENAEMMREIDEYAEMLGTKEQQYNELRFLAKPLLQKFVDEI